MGIFIPKIPILAIWGLWTHIFRATVVKFGTRLQTYDSLPKPNFVKVAKGGIPLLGKGLVGIALPRGGDAY